MHRTRQIPESWQVSPEQCKFLGTDPDGYECWCITSPTIAPGIYGREVMRHKDGATRWLCSWHAWPTFCKITTILPA